MVFSLCAYKGLQKGSVMIALGSYKNDVLNGDKTNSEQQFKTVEPSFQNNRTLAH